MNRYWWLIALAGTLLSACTGVGVYHVSERPLPGGDGVYLLQPNGTYVVDYAYRHGRYPDVGNDGKTLLWVKPLPAGVGGTGTAQVWRTDLDTGVTELLTTSVGDKRYPRWSEQRYAYQRDTGDGDRIVVSSHDNATEFELAPTVRGGLDFFDHGNRIVFAADTGIYWIDADPNATPTQIVACAPNVSRCRHPVISHDGSLLAFRHTLMLASGWIDTIRVLEIDGWLHVQTVSATPPAELRGATSFDFSPDDSALVFTARSTDVTGDNQERLELFSIERGTVSQDRLTDNTIPDYYPATLATGNRLQPVCESFDGLTYGQQLPVGATVTGSGVTFAVAQFQWGNGNWTTNGYARADNRGYAGGAGLDVQSNNVTLDAQDGLPAGRIWLKFAELGGNNNVTVNGTLRNVADLVSLDGTAIAGVQVAVNATRIGGNWQGQMVLNGHITAFALGGQELWIDDYCYLPG